MTTENTQLAQKPESIRSWIEKYKDQFAAALPRLVKPERFVRVALTCLNRNPKLAECTRDSLLGCLLDCAMLGIEPDGRRAHLIPYGNKCTLIIDYKGIAELVRRSGEVATLHCDIVYPKDDFDYAFGTGQFLKHKPSLESRADGKPLCVYSYVKLKDGQEDFDVMSIDAVMKIKARSRASTSGPWVTDFDEMAKKTIFRRHSKWLPLSPELRDKIEKDDEPMTEEERFRAAKPAEGVVFGAAMPEEAPTPQTQQASTPRKKKEKAAPPPDERTPLDKLRALLQNAKIDELELRRNLVARNEMLPDEMIATLPEEKLENIISRFVEIAEDIRKPFE